MTAYKEDASLLAHLLLCLKINPAIAIHLERVLSRNQLRYFAITRTQLTEQGWINFAYITEKPLMKSMGLDSEMLIGVREGDSLPGVRDGVCVFVLHHRA